MRSENLVEIGRRVLGDSNADFDSDEKFRNACDGLLLASNTSNELLFGELSGWYRLLEVLQTPNMSSLTQELAWRIEQVQKKGGLKKAGTLLQIKPDTASNIIQFKRNGKNSKDFLIQRTLPTRTLGWYGFSEIELSFSPDDESNDEQEAGIEIPITFIEEQPVNESPVNEPPELTQAADRFTKAVQVFNHSDLSVKATWFKFFDAHRNLSQEVQKFLLSDKPEIFDAAKKVADDLLAASPQKERDVKDRLNGNYDTHMKNQWNEYLANCKAIEKALEE